MLNSVLLLTWFCFRNDIDLCHLANSDIIKKEIKSLVWGGLFKKKNKIREAAFGECFCISFIVGEMLPAFLLLISILS